MTDISVYSQIYNYFLKKISFSIQLHTMVNERLLSCPTIFTVSSPPWAGTAFTSSLTWLPPATTTFSLGWIQSPLKTLTNSK